MKNEQQIWIPIPGGLSSREFGHGYQGSYNGIPLVYELNSEYLNNLKDVYNPWESGVMTTRGWSRPYLMELEDGSHVLGGWNQIRSSNPKRVWMLDNGSEKYVQPEKPIVQQPTIVESTTPEVTHTPVKSSSGDTVRSIRPIQTRSSAEVRNVTSLSPNAKKALGKIQDGVPLFNLGNYSEDDITEAINAVYGQQDYSSPVVMQDSSEINANQSRSSTTNSSRQGQTVTTNGPVKKANARYSQYNNDEEQTHLWYSYPQKQVHLYNIHPDAIDAVLEQLKNKQKQNSSNTVDNVLLATQPLPGIHPGTTVNDSIYHFIPKTGIPSGNNTHWYMSSVHAYENPYIVGNNYKGFIYDDALVPREYDVKSGTLSISNNPDSDSGWINEFSAGSGKRYLASNYSQMNPLDYRSSKLYQSDISDRQNFYQELAHFAPGLTKDQQHALVNVYAHPKILVRPIRTDNVDDIISSIPVNRRNAEKIYRYRQLKQLSYSPTQQSQEQNQQITSQAVGQAVQQTVQAVKDSSVGRAVGNLVGRLFSRKQGGTLNYLKYGRKLNYLNYIK